MKDKKVIITHDGMSKSELMQEAVANPSIHPVTREFHKVSYTFNKGDKGIIVDLNAMSDRWKVDVEGVIKYVPCEWVEVVDLKKMDKEIKRFEKWIKEYSKENGDEVFIGKGYGFHEELKQFFIHEIMIAREEGYKNAIKDVKAQGVEI